MLGYCQTVISRVATVRENLLENDFFQFRENSGNFVVGQGNLERILNVRQKSGNLKIKGYCYLQKLYLCAF